MDIIDVNHYVIAKLEKKNMLLRVNKIENNMLHTTIERTRHIEPEYVSVKVKEVLAFLGKNPKVGSVHGVQVETWKSTHTHPVFGDVFIFHELEEKHHGRLLRAFDKVGKILKEYGVDKFLPCLIEVRAPKGKVAGSYRYSGREPDKHPDILTIRPTELMSDYAYVIAHEAAHGIWYRQFTSKKGKAAWVKMYHSFIEVMKLDEKETLEFYSRHFSPENLGSLKKTMKESMIQELMIQEVIDYIKRVHCLSIRNLGILADAGEDLTQYFPKRLNTSLKEYAVTQYSMKSPEEFFAECFAFYILGKELPGPIKTLMDRTLRSLSK